ncbi:hypothetical protein ACFL4C_01810 [Candidatus Omnitrophota bacterium]
MANLHYEVDPHNLLVIKKTGKKTELARFRQILDGRFKIDKNNNLVYHIKTPVSKDNKSPHQIKLKGKWSLDKNHDLMFMLNKWRRQTFGDKLTIQGDIIDINKNSLLFAVSTRTKNNAQSIYALKLQGKWQADKNNRLTFKINKGRGQYDVLMFDTAWKIGKNYQIIYEYEKTQLKRRQKKNHTLIFQGHWDIKGKSRISYVIDRNSQSVFNFKTSFGIFRDNYIKYKLGIELSRRRAPVRRIITLLGTWKIKKTLGLLFELRYNNSRINQIVFIAEAKLTKRNTILFKLRNNLNREIGAQLELSHKILTGQGQTFLRLLREKQESVVLAGAGWGW